MPITDVVAEVRGARDRAVGDEADAGLEPAQGVAELCREHEAREDEQVLRPLPRAQRHERGPQRRAALRQLDELWSRDHARRLSGPYGQHQLEAAAALLRAVEDDPSAERVGQLARDGEPEPRAA